MSNVLDFHVREDATVVEHMKLFRPMLEPDDVNEVVVNRPGEVCVERSGRWDYVDVPGLTFEHCRKRVLFIGQQPETVDFSDPALPPGFDAAKIHAGIAIGMQQMADRGWAAELCLVPPDASATEIVKKQLAGKTFDCVVIGGGIRIPPKSLLLFEQLVNAVHRAAPGAAIAFNTTPQDTADAVARRFRSD